MTERLKVLMVCLGNICRSPTAEGIFRAEVEKAGLDDAIGIDSAGTSNWHIGEPPDPRTVHAAALRDYDLSALRGRQVHNRDFEDFDYILAMDEMNLDELLRRCPDEHRHKLQLFLRHGNSDYREVPDPYDGGREGFELVLDLVEDASRGLLNYLIATHALSASSR